MGRIFFPFVVIRKKIEGEWNMKRRKYKYILCVCMIICTLAGCKSVEKERTTADTWEETLTCLKEEAPEQLGKQLKTKVSDKISIDAPIMIPNTMKEYMVSDITVTRHMFDYEFVAEYWKSCLKELEIEEEVSRTSDDLLEDGSNPKLHNVVYKDGSYISSREHTFSMSREDMLEKRSAIIAPLGLGSNYGLEYATQEDLDFKTIEEADKELREMLETFGVTNLVEENICYAASVENLKKAADAQEEECTHRMKVMEITDTSISKEDEMYWFEYMQGYNEIPFVRYGVEESVTGSFWGRIEDGICICYGAGGIASIEAGNFYDFKEAKEEKEIWTVGAILEKFVKQKESDLNAKKVKVTSIELSYLPIVSNEEKMEFDCVPVWAVVYKEWNEESSLESESVVIYSARDGKIYDQG